MARRGKNYRKALETVEKKDYPLSEAIGVLKGVSFTKFDQTLEIAQAHAELAHPDTPEQRAFVSVDGRIDRLFDSPLFDVDLKVTDLSLDKTVRPGAGRCDARFAAGAGGI